MVYTIFTSYLFPFMALLFLLFLIHFNPLFDKKQTTLFVIAILVNIFLIIITSLDYVCVQLKWPLIWVPRRISSFINFATAPVIPLLLLKIFTKHKLAIWSYIPFIANIFLCFFSIFTNLVFFISEENTYSRGLFFFVPFTIAIFYIIVLIFKPIKNCLQGKKTEKKFLIAVVIMLICSVILEVKFAFQFANWTCTAVGLIMYYLLLTIQGSVIEPLTGTYNRMMYGKALQNIDKKRECIISEIDVNNLKLMNDIHGHKAGDTLLIRLVEIISQNTDKHTSIYRIGGDEFVLLSLKASYSEIKEMLDHSHNQAVKENISFAYGITKYHPQQDLSDVLKQVDTFMYEHKTKSKEQQYSYEL